MTNLKTYSLIATYVTIVTRYVQTETLAIHLIPIQAMYQRVFDWVVHQVNSSVEMEDCGVDSIVIGVLDIYGS